MDKIRKFISHVDDETDNNVFAFLSAIFICVAVVVGILVGTYMLYYRITTEPISVEHKTVFSDNCASSGIGYYYFYTRFEPVCEPISPADNGLSCTFRGPVLTDRKKVLETFQMEILGSCGLTIFPNHTQKRVKHAEAKKWYSQIEE